MVFGLHRRRRYSYDKKEKTKEYIPIFDSTFFNPISKIVCVLTLPSISFCTYAMIKYGDLIAHDKENCYLILFTELLYCFSIGLSLWYKRFSKKNIKIKKGVLEFMSLWMIFLGITIYRLLCYGENMSTWYIFAIHLLHMLYPLMLVILEYFGVYWCRYIFVDSDKSCPICLDDYELIENKENKTKVLACDHKFHAKCIEQWNNVDNYTCDYAYMKNTHKCPMCSQ